MAKGRLFRLKYIWLDLARIIFAIPTLLIYRPKRIYSSEEAKKKIRGAAFVATNHRGYSDPVKIYTILWYRRIHCLAKSELYSTAIMRAILAGGRCIKIDNQNPTDTSYVPAIREAIADGRIVAIYPEGKIVRDSDEMLEFKSGIVILAASSKAPIVPVYIKPQKHFWNRLTAAIGEPLYPYTEDGKLLPLSDLENLTRELSQKMKDLQKLTQ